MQRIVKIVVFIFFLFIIGVLFISLGKDTNYNTETLIGKKISKINLEYFNEKKFFKEEDLKKNNYTLINFWASWCGPCRDEHPLLLKLSEEKNLKLLGVNFKDKKKKAKKFLDNLGNPYDFLAKDEFGKQSVNFGIYGIPESILVNNNLVILQKFIGPISYKDYDLIIKIIN
ncbi:DsbE family thiol:disulfide interchange protein [Pelagibacteraceae bacterium]|nr:DsbE family thiol:disulfide interchange protein [Pelagibacteraceae bacterium]MDC0937547.1 DsbE family thiol:disulfide interchange protein [Pelagibacteraceae bacterium]